MGDIIYLRITGEQQGDISEDAGRKSLSGIGINRDMRMKYLFLVFREE